MSADKEKIEALTKRVDELVLIMNGIMEDLRQVSASLKSLAVSQITQPIAAHPAPALSQKEDYIMIKPRQFLGSDNFSKIASVVRGAGGDYVSAGKASHFRVPKKRT
jgi:hypothetical protein